jgi:PAS domain S-box-containing protein
VNDAYCQMTGFSEAELRSMTIADVEAAESHADTAAHIQKVISTGQDRFESRHRTRRGTFIPVEVSTQFLAGPPGTLFALVRDISAHKEAEARQRATEQQLQQAQRWWATWNSCCRTQHPAPSCMRPGADFPGQRARA